MKNKDLEKIEQETKSIEDRIKQVEERIKERDEARFGMVAKGSTPYPIVGSRSNSDEAQCLRYFGVKNAKQLLEVNTGHPRFARVPEEYKFLVQELKRDIDISRLTQQIINGEPLDRNESPAYVKGILENSYGRNVLAPRLKAFDSTTPGAGDEWVPTAVSTQYIEEYELERKTAQQFRQINMPSDPYDLPVQTNVTKARIQAESGTLTGANFGTASIRLDATKLTEFYPLPEELNEDSAPDILALCRSEVVEAEIRAVEAAILNGDDSVTHMDADTAAGAADLSEKAWKGLRKLALDNSATQDFLAAAVDLSGLRAMRTQMGKFGHNVRELVWIASMKVYNQMLSINEVTTVEKFGPQATILNGALAALDGIPIITSEYVRDDLDATGVNILPGDSTSVIHLVNHRRFYFGVRRPIRVKVTMDPTPPADRWLIAAWWRGDFAGHAQSASETSSVLGINIGG